MEMVDVLAEAFGIGDVDDKPEVTDMAEDIASRNASNACGATERGTGSLE